MAASTCDSAVGRAQVSRHGCQHSQRSATALVRWMQGAEHQSLPSGFEALVCCALTALSLDLGAATSIHSCMPPRWTAWVPALPPLLVCPLGEQVKADILDAMRAVCLRMGPLESIPADLEPVVLTTSLQPFLLAIWPHSAPRVWTAGLALLHSLTDLAFPPPLLDTLRSCLPTLALGRAKAVLELVFHRRHHLTPQQVLDLLLGHVYCCAASFETAASQSSEVRAASTWEAMDRQTAMVCDVLAMLGARRLLRVLAPELQDWLQQFSRLPPKLGPRSPWARAAVARAAMQLLLCCLTPRTGAATTEPPELSDALLSKSVLPAGGGEGGLRFRLFHAFHAQCR